VKVNDNKESKGVSYHISYTLSLIQHYSRVQVLGVQSRLLVEQFVIRACIGFMSVVLRTWGQSALDMDLVFFHHVRAASVILVCSGVYCGCVTDNTNQVQVCHTAIHRFAFS
jgi:hypothetical protein